jgi:hypothetical protein
LSPEEKIKATAKDIEGRFKAAAGDITGDDRMKEESEAKSRYNPISWTPPALSRTRLSRPLHRWVMPSMILPANKADYQKGA